MPEVALVPLLMRAVLKVMTLWVPIVMNLPRAGLVAWVRTVGQLLIERGNEWVGFRFGKVDEIRLDLRPERFQKSHWPEIVLHPKHPSVPIVPSEGTPRENRSDANSWNCGFLVHQSSPACRL